MEIEHYDHGVPSWVDVSSPDLPAARAFYSGLFGWDIAEGPPEAGGYSIAEIGGKSVAGVGPQMNPAAPPAWMTYVNVDDADVIAEKVTSAGGQVFMGPMQVMEAGKMAVFADPAGAVFGVWQPGEHKGAVLVNEPNTYCWSELMTTDLEGSTAFYATVFGWDAVASDAGGDGGAYTEWKIGDRPVGGMLEKPAEVPAEVPPNWGTYFAVADVDAALEKLKKLGGTVMMGPMEVAPGRIAAVLDPSNAFFNLIQMKEAPAT